MAPEVCQVVCQVGSDQVNCLIEQIISIKKGLIPGLERQFEG